MNLLLLSLSLTNLVTLSETEEEVKAVKLRAGKGFSLQDIIKEMTEELEVFHPGGTLKFNKSRYGWDRKIFYFPGNRQEYGVGLCSCEMSLIPWMICIGGAKVG